MHRHRTALASALMLLGALLIAPVALAQTQATAGNITGVITDPDGAPLPGVSITVISEDTGRIRTATSSNEGIFRVPLLPPGSYTVRAELTGFQSVEQREVRVSIGSAQEVNFQLQLESVQEVLIVTGQAPVVETTKTQVSSTITEDAIDSLPILGRDFTDFTLLTPGTLIEGSRNTVAMSGQRGISTSVNIDGTSSNSAFFGYQRGGTDSAFTVSQESVQEFQVITSGIMPEFGRSGGGLVNVVTKSGTNSWRGGGHLFVRDEGFASEDPFGREQEEFSVKQFGGNIGGPIVENSTFVFSSADVQDFQTPFFVDYDLSPEEFAELESYVAQFRPDWNIQQVRSERTNDTLVLFGKIDQSLGENHQLSARVNWSDHETIGGGTDTNLQGTTTASLSSLGDQTEKTVSAVLQITSVLGDRAFNEFRVQYATDDLDRISNDILGPDTDIRNPFVQLGRRFFMPIFVRESKWQVQNNFSYLFDDHDIKAGFDIETDDTGEFFAAFPAGEFRFGSLDEFLANEPDFLLQGFGTFDPGCALESPRGCADDLNFNERQTVAAAYIQDSWRVSDKLTVNYGLRWEGTFNPTPPGNPARPVTQQVPDDTDNWQPRVGLAYAPDPQTVFRASAGLFYSRSPTLLFFNPFTSFGLPNTGVFFFPGFAGELDGLWPNVFPTVPEGVTAEQEIYWFDPDYEEAQTLRVNAGVEREVVEDLSLGVSYIFARANGLQSLFDNNLVAGTVDENGRLIYGGRIEDGVQWRIDNDVSWSRYHALIFELKKRFSDGWGAMANYTYARDKDTDSQERSASGSQPTNIFDISEDFGPSDRDIKHRFVVSAFGDLPLGFKISGIYVARSGQPYNGVLSDDLNGDTETNDRPVVNGEIIERNSFNQPWFYNLDLRLTKQFSTKYGNFQFFIDGFNVLNNDNLFTTRTQFDSSRFGDLNTFIGNVRQFQLGFKYIY